MESMERKQWLLSFFYRCFYLVAYSQPSYGTDDRHGEERDPSRPKGAAGLHVPDGPSKGRTVGAVSTGIGIRFFGDPDLAGLFAGYTQAADRTDQEGWTMEGPVHHYGCRVEQTRG